MPIHEKLRGRDFPTMKNYLKVTLCDIHDELTKRMDTRAMARGAYSQPSSASNPLSNCSGRGGQPRMCRSTGITAETPPTTA